MNESLLRQAFEEFVRAAHNSSQACYNSSISAQIENQNALFAARRELDSALDMASAALLMKG